MGHPLRDGKKDGPWSGYCGRVDYAVEWGAPAVEAYPRAGTERTGDDNAYIGTEPLFRQAGFEVIRKPLKDVPRNWIPRVTMRISARE